MFQEPKGLAFPEDFLHKDFVHQTFVLPSFVPQTFVLFGPKFYCDFGFCEEMCHIPHNDTFIPFIKARFCLFFSIRINNSSIKGHFRPVCHALLLVVCIRGEWQEHVGMRHTHIQPHTVHSGTAVVLQWRCRRRGGGFKASLWLGLSVEAKRRPKGPHYDRNFKTLYKNHK